MLLVRPDAQVSDRLVHEESIGLLVIGGHGLVG